MMGFFKGLLYSFVFWVIYLTVLGMAVKDGYHITEPSVDARFIVTGLIIAGAMAGDEG